ncbi:hypothetical protein PMI01_00619 [Caulobacter sp. AP07]|nr:benenodin family lasso peptide [Caulobacter sp. AP07]EJL37541.1 hypothetical protein PMI01_00619 [Caulobacter sp. AP07]
MERTEHRIDDLIELGAASVETKGADLPTSEVGIGRQPAGITED